MSLMERAVGLAAVISDFREFEGVRLGPDDVLRWAYQFEVASRERLISCMHALLNNTYVSKDKARGLLLRILESENLTRGNPLEYWSSTHVIRDQVRGNSQRLLVDAFSDLAKERFGEGFAFANHLANRSFYLDDYIFSGGRVKEDFARWADRVQNYQGRFHLDMGFFGIHSLGEYFFKNYVDSNYPHSRSNVTYQLRRIRVFENRKARRNSSSVFWPSINAASVGFDAFDSGDAVLRVPPGSVQGIWNEADRSFLEKLLLEKGCRIAASCAARVPSMRPLGFYNFGYGFGATCSSYLNCPNNAPLALWWTARTQGLPNGWHALLPRRTND